MEGMLEGVWGEVLDSLRQEFSDVPDAAGVTRILVRLTLATGLGALIGYERESAGKAAGLRTHMLVALGSALFVLVPLEAGVPMADMSRVLQGIASGVGFLGAGAILKLNSNSEAHIKGLTTAAGIWMVAAIGVAAGMGRESTAVIATVFTLVILTMLGWIKDDGNGKKKESLLVDEHGRGGPAKGKNRGDEGFKEWEEGKGGSEG